MTIELLEIEKNKRKDGFVFEQTGASFGFAKHLERKTRADGNDEGTTERSEQEEEWDFGCKCW